MSSLVDRIGARWTAFAAGLVIVLGFIGSFFATTFLHLILTHGLLAGDWLLIWPFYCTVGLISKFFFQFCLSLAFRVSKLENTFIGVIG